MTDRFIRELPEQIIVPENINAQGDEKPQLSTDNGQLYPPAILDEFGSRVSDGGGRAEPTLGALQICWRESQREE